MSTVETPSEEQTLSPTQELIGNVLVDRAGMDAKLPKAFRDANPPPRETEAPRYGFKEVQEEVREAARAAAGAEAPTAAVSEQPGGDVGPEQPSSEPPATVKAPSPFSAELVEQAELLGFSTDDYPTPAALERAIRAFDNRLLAIGRQEKPAEPPQPSAAPKAAPQSAPAQPPAPAAKPDDFADLLAKLEKDFDPEFAGVVKAFNEHHQQRYAALEEKFSHVEQFFRQQEVARFTGEFDDWIEANDGIQQVLGSGRYETLKPNSAELQSRQQVAKLAQTLAQHYASSGLPVPRRQLLFQKALAAAFPEKLADIERSKLTQRIRDSRTGQFIGRPTEQAPPRTPPKDPTEAAVEAVTAKMREFHAVGA